jgi:NifU-like protein involved in Fe-S cluster formation
MKQVSVTIDPMGNTKIEALNFHGVGCTEATASLESALAGGGGKMEREYKEEWAQTETVEQTLTNY